MKNNSLSDALRGWSAVENLLDSNERGNTCERQKVCRCISGNVIRPHEGGYSFSSSQERQRFKCPHIHKLNLGSERACPLRRGTGLGLGIHEQQAAAAELEWEAEERHFTSHSSHTGRGCTAQSWTWVTKPSVLNPPRSCMTPRLSHRGQVQVGSQVILCVRIIHPSKSIQSKAKCWLVAVIGSSRWFNFCARVKFKGKFRVCIF